MSNVAEHNAQEVAKQLTAAERRYEAYRMRLRGATLNEIAKHFGVSGAAAGKWVNSEVDRIAAVRQTDLVRQRQIAGDRLDYLLTLLWEKVEQRGHEAVNAAAQILKIEERRAKLLGLDAPQRVVNLFDLDEKDDPSLAAMALRMGLSIQFNTLNVHNHHGSDSTPTVELLPGESAPGVQFESEPIGARGACAEPAGCLSPGSAAFESIPGRDVAACGDRLAPRAEGVQASSRSVAVDNESAHGASDRSGDGVAE